MCSVPLIELYLLTPWLTLMTWQALFCSSECSLPESGHEGRAEAPKPWPQIWSWLQTLNLLSESLEVPSLWEPLLMDIAHRSLDKERTLSTYEAESSSWLGINCCLVSANLLNLETWKKCNVKNSRSLFSYFLFFFFLHWRNKFKNKNMIGTVNSCQSSSKKAIDETSPPTRRVLEGALWLPLPTTILLEASNL